MNVLDSSALAKFVNREPSWEKVGRILEEACVTLELSVKEVANTLWKRVLSGEIDKRLAQSVMDDFLTLRPFKLALQEELYRNAFQVALEKGITVYDALFIQLAVKEESPLVTSDARQAKVAQELKVKTILIP